MSDRFLTWLWSLRVRLIITYVLVTAFAFGLLALFLLHRVERTLTRHEENTLIWQANTLGTTIRTPWRVDADTWLQDQHWTHRRCQNDIAPMINARIRLLDADGRVLTDSKWTGSWDAWLIRRAHVPPLAARPEVASAVRNVYGGQMRRDEDKPDGRYNMYVAVPISRIDPATNAARVAFIIYINEPLDRVAAVLASFRHLLKIGILATLLFTILVSILFSSNLTARLRAATQVARDFAAGQMERRMREGGRDEVGELAAAFNQMAEALQRNESLRRALLADVSHELRTPLTAITGCAESLSDGVLREDRAAAERFLAIITREAERLRRLVNDILELSKLQAGAVPIPRAPMPIAAVVEDAVEVACMQAPAGATVCCATPPDILAALHVYGNEDRLLQALRNLLDNALHHTAPGGTVTVCVEATDATVVVLVRDEGEGIPAEDLPWVFDRFYRGSGAGTGTGLGLAIVREIMLAHDGRVTVQSTVGQGTTFSLHLPRAQAAITVSEG